MVSRNRASKEHLTPKMIRDALEAVKAAPPVEERFARGGIVHGHGEDIPIRFDGAHEHLLTADQASRFRDVLQQINDGTSAVQRPTVMHADSSVVFVGGTASYAAEPLDVCHNCGQRIRVMINRGTGWCSEQCRKRLAGELNGD